MTLPVPLTALSYTRDVVSDYPDEERGASQGVLTHLLDKVKPITVAIPANLRLVSGTQTLKLDGLEGESGTLTVTWQFAVQ